jgi:predicted regulator of Ras-like GTPase activity (Roadblock/LC7/MglB family)
MVPLIFFPKDFGLKLSWPLYLLLAFELGWYLLIFFLMFSKASAPKVFLFALLNLSYRISLGIGFGILLLVMFSLPFFSSLQLGIHQYMPAFLLQALMSPFVLKSLFEVSMRKEKGTERALPELQKKETEPFDSSFVLERAEKRPEDGKTFPSPKEIKMTKEGNLENPLHYLREYAGVKAAILVDKDGLVVEKDSSSDFEPEKIASLARYLKQSNDMILHKMGGRTSERIGIYTPDMWICLNQIEHLTLVVLSDRRTDELLSVRISQSTGMIKKILAQRYQKNVLKVVEA